MFQVHPIAAGGCACAGLVWRVLRTRFNIEISKALEKQLSSCVVLIYSSCKLPFTEHQEKFSKSLAEKNLENHDPH